MSAPRSPERSAEEALEVELEPLDIELEFGGASATRASSIEVSYDELDPSSAHASFSDAGAVARRATRKRRAAPASAPLVGRSREVRIKRAELLRALAESAGGSHRARLLASAAELFESVGDPRAGRMFDNAIADEPPDPVALRSKRRLASRGGDHDEVLGLLRREVELPLAPIEKALARVMLADRLDDRGAAGEALLHAKRAHAAAPDSSAACLAWVRAAARSGEPGAAVEALAAACRVVKSAPLRGILALELAHRAELAENAEAALAWAEAALGHSPNLLAAHLVAIRAGRKLGAADSVRAHVVALSSRLPDGPARSALLRWTARWARANGDSAATCAGILKLPTSAADFRFLAELDVREGDLAAARRHLHRAAELSSNAQRAAALRDLTCLELRAGATEAALAAAREAARADPGSPLEARLRAFLGDDRRTDDPLARAAKAAAEGAVELELAALLKARDAGEAPYASELVSTDLSGLQDGGGTFVESVALELARRPKTERGGLALATALLRAGEGDVDGALSVLESVPDDPLADRLAAELRGEPLSPSGEAGVEPLNEAVARLVDRAVESPEALASALHARLEAFARDPRLLSLARRASESPVIVEARRAALLGDGAPRALLAEAALLSLGRGERGEKNPYARALRERGPRSPMESLLVARVAELSHAPLEAARVRAAIEPAEGGSLVGSRLALQGGHPELALELAMAAQAAAPRSIAAARALEVAALETGAMTELARAESALVEALAPSDDGVAAARALRHASRHAPESAAALARAARRYAHRLDVVRVAEWAIRATGEHASPLLEALALGYATVLERASGLVRAAEVAERDGDTARALRLLSDAVAAEPSHPTAAIELARLERAAGDVRGALEALKHAAAASGVSTRRAALTSQAAELAERALGDEAQALELYAAALSADRGRAEAAARAIALARARGEPVPDAWLASADASALDVSHAAALDGSPGGRPSKERLEAALTADPSHTGALRALATLELEEGNPERAIRHAKALIEAARHDDDRRFGHVTMARLMDDHRGDLAASAAHYGMALDLSPGDETLLGRVASAKARLGDPSAGPALKSAIEALHAAIERRPDREEGWRTLVETLEASGFSGAASTAASVAAALGVREPAPGAHTTGPLDAARFGRLAPRSLSSAARAFFYEAREIFSALAPFRPERWEATPLDDGGRIASALADLATDQALEIYVSGRAERACIPASVDASAILVGRRVLGAPAEQLRFLAAAAQALAAAGLSPAVQLNENDLEKCAGSILAALDVDAPAFAVHRSGPFVDAARALLPARREALDAAAAAFAAEGAFDARIFAGAAMRLGYRAALARLGDGEAALGALMTLHDVTARPGRERVEALRSIPSAWDLVLFSASPACIDARRRAERSR